MSIWIQVEELGLTFELWPFSSLSSGVKSLEESKELLQHWSYEYGTKIQTKIQTCFTRKYSVCRWFLSVIHCLSLKLLNIFYYTQRKLLCVSICFNILSCSYLYFTLLHDTIFKASLLVF